MSNTLEIETRVEKLGFIVEELDLGLRLARACAGDFLKRSIARHVLIRAKDFIDHARALRRPLKSSGYDVSQFHTKKEAYASAFDEYFAVARSKLGGHVQDLDFATRLELWNDVEFQKVSYFVEGAREMLAHLGSLGTFAAAYTPPTTPRDQEVRELIADVGVDADPSVPQIGVDSLAAARPNTVSLLNFSPVHQRAQQLCLLDVWIRDELDLSSRLNDHLPFQRILLFRLLTDIVSFADCLLTRPVVAGAPQALRGLDDLLRDADVDPVAIDTFKTRFRLTEQLKPLRALRNRLGAHVEIDPQVTMEQLLVELSTTSVLTLKPLYAKLESCFSKACRESFFLSSYNVRRSPLRGVLRVAGDSASSVPFDDRAPEMRDTSRQMPDVPCYESHAIRSNLERWITAAEDMEVTREYFWGAFSSSQVVETVAGTTATADAVVKQVQLRRVHVVILKELLKARSSHRASRILELIGSGGRGYPAPLTEITLRYWQSQKCVVSDAAIARTLAEVGTWEEVEPPLTRMLARGDPEQQMEVLLAMFQVFLRDEGIKRANRCSARPMFEDRIRPQVLRLSGRYLVGALLAFASIAAWGSYVSETCSAERDWILTTLRAEAVELLGRYGVEDRTRQLDALIRWGDFIGICLVIAEAVGSPGTGNDKDWFNELAIRGLVVCARHPQGESNLAVALSRTGRKREAIEVISALAARHPEDPQYGVKRAGFLLLDGRATDALGQLEDLVFGYTLDADEERQIDRLRVEARRLLPEGLRRRDRNRRKRKRRDRAK